MTDSSTPTKEKYSLLVELFHTTYMYVFFVNDKQLSKNIIFYFPEFACFCISCKIFKLCCTFDRCCELYICACINRTISAKGVNTAAFDVILGAIIVRGAL